MSTAKAIAGFPAAPRQRIIEAARTLFMARGFTRVTMDELAVELKISKKTLYRHFSGKDELLEAAIEWQILHIKRQIAEICAAPSDFIERLERLCSFIITTLARASQGFLEDLRRSRPDLWKRMTDFRRAQIEGEFARLVREGRRLGLVRADVNIPLFIQIYVAAVQGVINPGTLSRHGFTPDEAYRGIVSVMFEGILSDEAKPHFRRRLRPSRAAGGKRRTPLRRNT